MMPYYRNVSKSRVTFMGVSTNPGEVKRFPKGVTSRFLQEVKNYSEPEVEPKKRRVRKHSEPEPSKPEPSEAVDNTENINPQPKLETSDTPDNPNSDNTNTTSEKSES